MQDSWTCLLVEKGPGMLSDSVRTALKMSACDLHLKRLDRIHLKHDECEAIVQTEWKTHMVGIRSGVLFRAQVLSEDGDYFVNFLLNEDDLTRGAEFLREMREGEVGAWDRTSRHPVDELYEFKNLRKNKMH